MRLSCAVKAAIRDPNPVVFLENELMYGTSFSISPECEKDDFVLPLDKAKVMRAGADVTIVSFSRMVGLCLQASEELAKEGIQAEVIAPANHHHHHLQQQQHHSPTPMLCTSPQQCSTPISKLSKSLK